MPLGFWIKQLDQLLTEGIDKIQAQFGLTRIDWQILNFLSEQSETEKESLLAAMKPFINSKTANEVLNLFNHKGFVNINDNLVNLTDKGKRQHADCFEKQKEFRKMSMKNISREDYQKTIQTLQKMIDNLKD